MSLWSRVLSRRSRAGADPAAFPRMFDVRSDGEPSTTPLPPSPTLAELVDRSMEAVFSGPDGAAEPSASAGLGVTAIELPAPCAPDSPPSGPPGDEPDPIRAFCEITRSYMAPVRRFVARLAKGPASSAGLEMHRPAMEMVVRAAERLPVGELVTMLSRFAAALQSAVDAREPIVTGAVRTRILEAYAALEVVLPAAFRIDEPGPPEADGIILLALLRQIPDVGTVTVDKILGARLTSVDMFAEATPKDLAVTTGISESLATRICVRVQGYLAARTAADDPAERAERIARVAALVAELRGAHEEYEVLRREDRVRWAHRRRRLDLVLKIQVALAELGERELVEALRPLAYERRIDRLARYVESAGGRVPRLGGR